MPYCWNRLKVFFILTLPLLTIASRREKLFLSSLLFSLSLFLTRLLCNRNYCGKKNRMSLVKLIRLFYIFIAFHSSLQQTTTTSIHYPTATTECPQKKEKMLNGMEDKRRRRRRTWWKTLINIFMLMIFRGS